MPPACSSGYESRRRKRKIFAAAAVSRDVSESGSFAFFGPRSRVGPSPLASRPLDFCCEIKAPCGAFSHDFATPSRSPEVSSTAFRTQTPNLQPEPLINTAFAVIGQIAQRRLPQIRFLYIGSYVCSTLPPNPASRRRLHLDQVVEGTFTPSCRTCSAHTKSPPAPRREPAGRRSAECIVRYTICWR